MRFPKFALWLCASLLLVALTTADEDTSPPDDTAAAAEDTAAEDAAAEDTAAEDAVAEDTAAEDTAAEDTAAEDTAAEEETAIADTAASEDTAAEAAEPEREPVVEEEIVDSSVREPVDGPVPNPPAAPADAATDDSDGAATEEEAEDVLHDQAKQEVSEPADSAAEAVQPAAPAEAVEQELEPEEAEAGDRSDGAGAAAVPELDLGDEEAEGKEAAMVTAETEAEDERMMEDVGPIETATELSSDEGKEEAEDEEEDASQTAASVEDMEAESDVTEQAKPEDAEPVATETDAPAAAPEGDTDETTTIKAEANETEVSEEEPTSAPVASSDVAAASPSEALSASVTSGVEEEVTAGVTTSPATVVEIAVETGSGAVARDNTTAVVVSEGNTTEVTTKGLPDKMEEVEEEEDVEVYQLEFYDLTDEQKNNIVTLELNSGSTALNEAYYLGVTQAISEQLDPIKGVLTYIAPSPQGGDSWMQLCMVVKVGDDGAVPQNELLAGIKNVNLTSFGLTVLKLYAGMPTYGLKVMEYKDLSKVQQSGVVTLELDFNSAVLNDDFFKNFIVTLAEHYTADVSPEDSLVFVAPTPIVSMGLLQMILVSEIGEDGAVPVKDFVQTLKKLNLSEAGLTIISVKEGMPPTVIQVVELLELSVDQQEGIVTIEFDRGSNKALQNEYAIAVAVREMEGMLENEGLRGNIVFIAPTPVEDNGKLQASFIMRPAKDEAVPQDKLLEAVRKLDLSQNVGVTVANSYTGMPTYGLPIIASKDLSDAQSAGIVTVEMDAVDKTLSTKFFHHVYMAANERIAASLVNVTNGSLSYVEPTPVVVGGRVHQSVFFTTADEGEEAAVIPAKELMDVMKKLNFSECEVYLRKVTVGLPPAHDLIVPFSNLTKEQQNNIVTMVLDTSDAELKASDLHVLSRLLAAEGAKGDVVLVATPVDEDNRQKVSIVLKDGEAGAVDQVVLLGAINKVDFDVLDTSLYEAYLGMTRPTTMPPPVFPQIQLEDITGPQKENVVTVEFEVKQGNVNDESLRAAHEAFSALLVAELNRMAREKHFVPDVDPEASKRRRREVMEEDVFKAEDVTYVAPTPRVQDGKLQFVTVVDDGQGNVASQADVLAAIENLNNTGKLPPNLALVTLYGGMPADMEATMAPPAARTAPSGATTWDSHMGLFLAIIILATICFIILIIGFMCIKYRSRRGSWNRKDDEAPIDPEPCGRKYPIVIENPIPDSEIMKGEAPMTESANPAMSYPVSKKDEDNGWVVPLDQLSPAERQKPDTENTKL